MAFTRPKLEGGDCMENKYYEEIRNDESLFAIIIRSSYKADKIKFFTPPDFSQQLGYLPHKAGNVIKPHIHKLNKREVHYTQEVLFIKRGKVRVNFYSNEKKYLSSRELCEGDIIILCSGGHGFKILEDTEMIEVKQGPYSGKDNDKEVFEGVEQ